MKAGYNEFDGKSIILFHVNASDATPIGNQSRSPKVIVSFSGYKPPFDPEPIVRRMLDSVPKHYLAGLGEVVLSNAGGLSSKRRNISVKSRKRRVGLSTAIGLYHPASRGNSAWIEIFVDNAFRGWEEGWWLFGTFSTTTSWVHKTLRVDLTGRAGCFLSPQFYAAHVRGRRFAR